MREAAFAFGPFVLDPAQRRLLRDGAPVEVSARYFDALTLLAQEAGRLVTKDRFHEEVWRGIPVTDEALTQCIRSLRRALDDDAAAPRYIETVPRHGYRFIAPVTGSPVTGSPVTGSPGSAAPTPAPLSPSRRFAPLLQDASAAALGGGVAGIVGGLLYLSAGLITPAMGTASTLLVLISMNLLLGLLGGAAVGLGTAAMSLPGGAWWRSAAGGMIGGLVIGAVAHMIGTDLFALLFGRTPGPVTGAAEGAALGLAVGAGLAGALRIPPEKPWARGLVAAGAGTLAGAVIALAGGRLMAGSLAEVAQRFPDSRLGFDQAGTLFAAVGDSRIGLAIATTLEAALFVGGVVGALLLVRRLRAAAG